MFIGIISGDTRPGPLSSRMSYWLSSEVTPPMPVPITTATRVGLEAGVARRAGEPGVRPGLAGRDQRGLLGAVEPAGLHARDRLGRVDGHRRGDPDRQLLGPVLLELDDAGAPFEQAGPERLDVATDRGGCPEAGDDDLVESQRHWTQALFSM